jgi:hypothetical protein
MLYLTITVRSSILQDAVNAANQKYKTAYTHNPCNAVSVTPVVAIAILLLAGRH